MQIRSRHKCQSNPSVAEYCELAEKLLGWKPRLQPLIPSQILYDQRDEKDGLPKIWHPPYYKGDLSPHDDQMLAALCGLSPNEWENLDVDQAIARLRVAISNAPDPPDPNIWPANRSEDQLTAHCPKHPDEAGEYTGGNLERDRFLFWAWQCGYWKWDEIIKIGQTKWSIGRKSNEGNSAASARSYAKDYGDWIGFELRKAT